MAALHVLLHPPINDRHKPGQAAITVFQVFVMTPPGIEPILPGSVERAVPLTPIKKALPRVDRSFRDYASEREDAEIRFTAKLLSADSIS